MLAVAEDSTLVHRAELCAPRGSDAGQCVARLPRVFRIPAGAPVLVARGSRTALCVALPLDAPPVRRKDVRDASCADGLPDGTSKTRIRVDRTLSFIASTSGCGADGTGPAGDALTVSRVLSALDRPRRQKSGAGWPPAEEVVVHVLAAAAATGLTAGAVVARAKTALRCVGCVPPPEAGGGASLCVFGADGVTAVARVSTFPPAPVVIALGTRFAVAPCAEDSAGDDSGPLRAQQETSHAYAAVRSLLRQDVQSHWALGSSPMTGLLLSGPPGIGKTSGVLAAAQDCGFAVACVRRGRDRSHGAPARALRAAFSEARNSLASGTRAIVFLDEIDALCPKRAGGSGGAGRAEENRAVAQLLSLMDGGVRRGSGGAEQVLYVVAATNRPGALDPALRRPGRFDRELVLQAPGAEERARILRALDTRLDEVSALEVAKKTAGYVPADIVQLHAEAARLDGRFELALQVVRPSLLRGALSSDVPVTRWEDIGGLHKVKRRLRMAVEWPLVHPATFRRLGLRGPRGVLLHGPPGCSKTTLGRAMATSGHANFLHLSGADVYSCFVGEAERLLREAFDTARAAAPTILFLDELDALVGKRTAASSPGTDGNQVQSRVLSTLLTEMDGLASSNGVLVVGATNRLDLLDDALLRPGRFDEILAVDGLSDADRLAVLRIHAARVPGAADVDLQRVAQWMPNATGAEVKSVCQEAALCAMRDRSSGAVVARLGHFQSAVRSQGLNLAR
jgi:transitional endoplasmic reticulum ATPase